MIDVFELASYERQFAQDELRAKVRTLFSYRAHKIEECAEYLAKNGIAGNEDVVAVAFEEMALLIKKLKKEGMVE